MKISFWCFKPWLKNRSNKSSCDNTFLELLLTKFWHYLQMNAMTASVYWLFHHIYMYDMWGGFFWKSISLSETSSFWKLKISFTEMFHKSLKKQFNWNLMLLWYTMIISFKLLQAMVYLLHIIYISMFRTVLLLPLWEQSKVHFSSKTLKGIRIRILQV